MNPEIVVSTTAALTGAAAAARVARVAADAAARRGRFAIALSGGALAGMLAPGLLEWARHGKIDWSAWHVFWADERCVPPDHPESNYSAMQHALFRHAGIPPEQIHSLARGHEPQQAALDYEECLRRFFTPAPGGFPRFDLVMLGMGEDGHTASLFPGHPLLEEKERWVAPVFDSPKPPPERITLTLPVVNSAAKVFFVAAGAGKAAALADVLGPHPKEPPLPARRVAPHCGTVRWFVDAAAAAQLKERAHGQV